VNRRLSFAVSAGAVAMFVNMASVHAAGSGFELAWHTIDCGGGTSTNATFELTGTIGQHDAGEMTGSNFSLTGGFWAIGFDPGFVCVGDFVSNATFQPPPDGNVDGADLAFLLGEWGPNPGSPADLVDNTTFQPPPDGVVDAADLAVLLGAWGACE
jgi:hypothetical protein